VLAAVAGACDRGGRGSAWAAGYTLSKGFSLSPDADSPAEFGEVPPFRLTDEEGRAVGLDDLLGTPFVLSAIFTRCAGPCPAVSDGVAELAKELQRVDVRFVSLSVDPGFDTPEVLRAYAESYGADGERWRFLTGSEEEIHALVSGGFKLAVDRSSDPDELPGMAVTHDTRLVAVDRKGRIRGYYDGRSPEGRGKIRDRMRFLAEEGAPPRR